jgi:hypothetical protein
MDGGVVGEPGAGGVGEGGLAEQVLLPMGFFLRAVEPARLSIDALLTGK